MSVLIRGARVLTMRPDPDAHGPVRAARGKALGELGVIPRADVLFEGETIARIEERIEGVRGATEIDARGRVLMPGFVDCHTHACWAGDRLDEWEMQRAGSSYLDILKAGGGIMSTVRAVRGASEDELATTLGERLGRMLRAGTTSVEVKSGYGLSTLDELKMLRAIMSPKVERPHVVPTALIAHAIDPEQPDFVERTINETLPALHEAFPGVTIDAYCEQGAWSLDACARLFAKAKSLGHPCRVHADQFNSLGMIPLAIEQGFRSVDHLEAAAPEELLALARSETFGVMLPCSGFHTDGRYADGRAFLDAGGMLAIATNCNPGSAPTFSTPFAIALAVRELGLTAQEAIGACTRNAAALLGLTDRGALAPGLRADAVLLRHTDERALAHEFGDDPVDVVIRAGVVVKGYHPPHDPEGQRI
ncbi:MAG: imidazolonepropionase [Phycisphaerales bacterium]|nr:MAG: imidazolonepropionase [Phycisphaerales bacterium]